MLILSDAGYESRRVTIPDVGYPMLVAEDAYSIVGVLTSSSWATVAQVLPEVELSFANWAVLEGGPAKRWDLYLIILVAGEISSDALKTVEAVVSDIRYVRKIVRGAVTATTDGVERALAPVLPVSPAAARTYGDPLDDLAGELLIEGVSPVLVAAAIESFRRDGEVSIP